MRRGLTLSALLAAGVMTSGVGAQFGTTNYPAFGAAPAALDAADMDNDGDVDLITVHTGPNLLRIHLNNGTGTAYSFIPIPLLGAGPVDVVAVDLDGANRRDIVVVRSGGLTVLRSTSPGGFGYSQQSIAITAGTPMRAVALDADTDGNRDIAVLCGGPSAVRVHRGTGSGTLATAAAAVAPVTIGPHAITAGNFNASAGADLVVSGSFGSGKASVLINTSPAGGPTVSFATEQLFDVDYRPFGVTAADFNGDGYVDFATSGVGYSTTSVMLNDPSVLPGVTVAFDRTDYPLLPQGRFPQAVVNADFDCDGDRDLAFACTFSNNVVVRWNNGLGAFPTQTPYAADTRPRDLVAADLRGDRGGDLATVNTTPSTKSVLLWLPPTTVCCHVVRGGIVDNFGAGLPPGPEDACPGPQLTTAMGGAPPTTRDFDGPATANLQFGHTFPALPARILTARLVVRLRAGPGGSSNDCLYLGLNGSSGFTWARRIAQLTSLAWVAGDTATLTLDLDALPGGASLLAKMNNDADLDIYAQDDTRVDFAELQLETCAPANCLLNLTITPYVTGNSFTMTASGTTASAPVLFVFGPALGPGPLLPDSQRMCVLYSGDLPAVANVSGVASFSMVLGPTLPRCTRLSVQAVSLDNSGDFLLSPTWTQQFFD